ncbi:oxygen tolerance protein BatD [Allofrancisella inopinata]|uniref:Protein BatD n=1 Tax=Allofrancisella inopinata TaxID=1085647 RepID=A0AAE7CRS5_9GAMM|nr:BatD family protein [Allofrancisella inopinata]QIV96719.1 protein BatD [Allofrancisella inopinata]TDT73475.1 oxygen tolerance protein BatD [Allofrancisella inopinata]
MKISLFKIIGFILTLFIAINISYANVSATIDRTHLEKGETAQLVLQLDNFDSKPDLSVLDKNFIVYNTSTSNKTTVINGKKSVQYEMIITLMPNKSGNLTIPAIKVGNQSTKPIRIKVDKSLSNEEETKYDDFFAIGMLATTKSYVNVPVLYTLKFYYSTPVLSLQAKPFQIKNSEIRQTSHRVVYQKKVNGRMYDVLEENLLIIPRSTGKTNVPAMVLQVTKPNGFGQLGAKTEYISTKPLSLNIAPIPDNVDIQDWFPASNVSLTDNWSQEIGIKEGELVTRTIKITADDVLSDDIPKLKFESTDGFNIYAEKPKLEDIENSGKLTGVATYKIGYMPIKQGEATVPDVKLKWYDVDTHKSKVAKIAAKKFNIQKGNLSNINLLGSSVPNTKIVHEKVVDPFWRNVAIFFIILWFITLLLLLKCKFRKPSYHDNVKSVAPRESGSLKEIKKACSNNDNIALQKALINWASLKFDSEIFSLLEIADLMPQLLPLLKNLNAAIYANKSFNQYKELLELVGSVNKKQKTYQSAKLIKGLYEK